MADPFDKYLSGASAPYVTYDETAARAATPRHSDPFSSYIDLPQDRAPMPRPEQMMDTVTIPVAPPGGETYSPSDAVKRQVVNDFLNVGLQLPNLPHDISSIPNPVSTLTAGAADLTARGLGALGVPGTDKFLETLHGLWKVGASSPGEIPKLVDMSPEEARTYLNNRGGDPNAVFDERMLTREMEAQQPEWSTVGDIGGDLSAIAVFGNPVRKMVRQSEASFGPKIKAAEEAFEGSPGFASFSEAWKAAKAGRATPRALRARRITPRVFQAAVEGKIVGMANENADTNQVAAETALAQYGGNQIYRALGSVGFSKSPFKNFLINTAALAGGIQAIKTMTPGGKDWLNESVETAFHKTVPTWLASMAAGAVAGRRLPQNAKSAMMGPMYDAFMGMPRHLMQSSIARWDHATDAERAKMEGGLSYIQENPDIIGEERLAKLEKLMDDDPDAFWTSVKDYAP